MPVTGSKPAEYLPAIGTVENAVVYYDGKNLHLFYQIAPADCDGVAVIKFEHVINFRVHPMDLENLGQTDYPASPWEFTEVYGADKTDYRRGHDGRFWIISFNDETIEVVFRAVKLLFETRETNSPNEALITFLQR